MTQARNCPTRLLPDSPADTDNFGAHQRLAEAIKDLVDNEPGGRTIGLEGSWGSGKSTVLNLLKHSMQDDQSVAILVFDAWAHQSDPLRRTFLETLIEYLAHQKHWIDVALWEKRKKVLTHTIRIVDTDTSPRLGFLGILITIWLVLVPLGLAALNAGFNSKSILGISPDILALFGIIVIVFPIVIYFVQGIRWAHSARYSSERKKSTRDKIRNQTAILAQKYTTNTRTETTENPNPTSVEFERMFSELMSDALDGKKRRLILAFDNLDRVPSEDALSILSVLQTFLQHRETSEGTWYEKVWVVIPYDASGIKRLWNGSNSSEELATAFLDKSFQVRFRVPPLLPSNWRSYLIELLAEAFPKHSESEFLAVYRVFDLHRQETTHILPPSPRMLKLFVNQIGAIHRQWNNDEFPLSHIAYSVHLRRKGLSDENIASGLLSGEFNSDFTSLVLEDHATDNLAAMLFNVPVKQARQLLLSGPTEEALRQNNVENLIEYANFPGFWVVIERLHFANWVPAHLANAASCLYSANILEGHSSEAKVILHRLGNSMKAVNSWHHFDMNISKGLTAFLELNGSEEIAVHFLNGLSASAPKAPTLSREQIIEWTEATLALLATLDKLKLQNAYQSTELLVPTDASGYLEACIQIRKHDPERRHWKVFRPAIDTTEIVSVVADAITRRTPLKNQAQVIEFNLITEAISNWDELIPAIDQRLIQNQETSDTEFINLVEILWLLGDGGSAADNKLTQLSQNYLYHYLDTFKSNSTAAGWIVFLLARYNPSFAHSPVHWNSQQGYNYLQSQILANPTVHEAIVNSFVQLLKEYDELDLLLRLLDANPQSKDWVAASMNAIGSDSLAELLAPEEFIRRWSFIEEELENDTIDELIRTLVKDQNYTDYISEQDFDLAYTGLYARIVQNAQNQRKSFFNWYKDGLANLGKDIWLNELMNEADTIELLLALIDQLGSLSFGPKGSNYQDALEEHAKAVISGKSIPKYYRNRWPELFKSLNSSQRKMLQDRLLEVMKSADGNLDAAFIDLYEAEISNPEALQRDARRRNSTLVSGIFVPIMRERDNLRALQWLAKIVAANQGILELSKVDYPVEDFMNRVRNALQETNEGDETHTLILEIANSIGIDITPPKDTESEDEPPSPAT